MKKVFIFLCLFIISVLLPLGCTNNNSDLSTSPNRDDKVLSIYNYSTYIDPGVITQFEQQFGVKVKYDTFETVDALYAKIKPGNPGYDIIFPSDYMVTIMKKESLIQPLKKENIQNVKNLDPKFINPPFDPGNQYSIPYQWGTMGLGYNREKTDGEIDSWRTAFDPKYQGKVSLMDELRSMMAGVLIYLGYNPNTTNPDEIIKARDFIIEHKDTIAAFAPDTGQLLLDQGEVDIAVEWSGDMFQVMEENPKLRYVIPKEGSVVWVDTMAIPTNAPHKELAEKFMNFVLEPEISAKISNFIRYASPNKVAIEQKLINTGDLNNPAIYPPPELFKKLAFVQDVGEASRLYDEAWTEIKVSVGK